MSQKITKFREEVEAPPRDLYPIRWEEVPPNQFMHRQETTKKAIMLFWWCSKTGKWDWFDFEKFFKECKVTLENWIYPFFEENCIGGSDGKNYNIHLEDDYSNLDEVLQLAREDGKDGSDISALIGQNTGKIEAAISLYQEMNKINSLSQKEKILLADSLVHFEHFFQSLWHIDISKLREKFEKYYAPKSTGEV